MPKDWISDDEAMARVRNYLKLLARTQVDTWLGERLDTSDLVQQTLLDAVAKSDQFRGESEGEFIAWLRRILTNNLVDAFRYHHRDKRNTTGVKSLDEQISESFRRIDLLVVDSGASPSENAVTNDQLLRLPLALESLPATQRDAIILHHLQGLKLAETAQRLGCSEAATGGLLFRGLKRLHELLQE